MEEAWGKIKTQSEEMSAFEAGILRVLKGDSVVGAAFLVSERLVATCAHVVKSAGGKAGETIVLNFSDGTMFNAQVVPEFWREANAEDIAILRLEKPLEEIQPFLLGSSIGTKGHIFSTLGFPKSSQALAGRGEIIGDAVLNGIKYLQLDSRQVTPGFSGAPVFDETTGRVVGMVVAIAPPDEYQRQGTTAFAIPSEILRRVCSEIQIVDICPYRSLDVFTEDDAPFFFGRESVIERMVDSLKREPRFLAVLGPSGSGKSSAVQAGLFPKIRVGEKWEVITIRPGADPFASLAEAGLSEPASGLADTMQQWLAQHLQSGRLALFIDQFEELLTLCPESTRKYFASSLLELLESPVACTVILTMRDDFYTAFNQEFAVLAPWLERGLVNVPLTITADEFRAMIESPAKKVGLELQSGLADVILADIRAANPGQAENMGRSTILPLLEFALTKLWERRKDGVLTHDVYRENGGVTGSLTQFANAAFYTLGKPQQLLARRILTDLVNIGDHERNLPNTKRRLSLVDLIRSEEEKPDVVLVINQLETDRLLVAERDRGGAYVVEVIHEALLREWGLLNQWLNEDRAFLTWRPQFNERFERWKSSNENIEQRDPGLLLGGLDLTEALHMLKQNAQRLSDGSRVFIRISKQHSQSAQRGRSILVFLRWAVPAVFIMVATYYVWNDKSWYRAWPIFSACPQVRQTDIELNGENLPANIEQGLRDATPSAKTNLLYCAPSSSIPAGIMKVTADFQDDMGNIELTIILPSTPAYQLDFLPEIRDFGPEIVSTEEAIALIKGASAYSVGNYDKATNELKNAQSLSALELLAQAYLYLDEFDVSRKTYDNAIVLAEKTGRPTDQLHMGAALAWWRPAMDYYSSQPTGGCDTSFDHYVFPLNNQPNNQDWQAIYVIAQSYCGTLIQQSFPPEIAPTATANEIFASIRQTIQFMDEKVDQEILNRYQAIRDSITLGHFELVFFYQVYEECAVFYDEMEAYKRKAFSQLDKNNLRFILLNQSCSP